MQKCLIIVKIEIEQSPNCKCMNFFKKKYIHANFVNSYAFGEVQCLYQYIICVCDDEF